MKAELIARTLSRLRVAFFLSVCAAVCAFGCDGSAPARVDDALVVLLPQAPEEIDPRVLGDAYGLKISRLLFASLVTIDPRTLEVVPDLAESVEVQSPTRVRVVLKPHLRFSDGSVLDAEDVIATFRSVAGAEIGSRYAATYRRIARMTREDARTVVFELAAPHATFLTDLEMPVLRAEDEHHALGGGSAAPPVSSGPYVLVSRTATELRLERNPRWYGGAPHAPRLRFVVVRDDNTRALRMLGGGGDLALNVVPPLLVPMFAGDPRFSVRSAPGVGTTYVGVNTEAPLLRDRRVREAIALAIDRRALIDAKLGGRARPALGWIPPGHWSYTNDLPSYAHDPARARALLDEAGVRDPDGEGPEPRARLVLRTSTDRFRQSIARAIAAMLGEVGLEVDVRPSEIATLLADLNRGRFELTTLQVPEVFEPNVLSWFFASDKIPRQGGEGANRWRFRNPALDRALARGMLSTDRAVRREAYLEAQQILAVELPVIPLWHEDVVAITSARGHSFDVPRDGRFATLAR